MADAKKISIEYENGTAKELNMYCPDCPYCKPKDTLRNGVKWGICGMSGNIVYLEPWKEKKIHGNGYISHHVSSCGLFEATT